MVPPNEFIPIAEETGVITEIGAWVIHQACKQLRAWKDQGYDPVPVAVNVSARQFVDKDLVKLIKEELSAFGLDPGLLELELTERVIMRSLEETGVKGSGRQTVGRRFWYRLFVHELSEAFSPGCAEDRPQFRHGSGHGQQ